MTPLWYGFLAEAQVSISLQSVVITKQTFHTTLEKAQPAITTAINTRIKKFFIERPYPLNDAAMIWISDRGTSIHLPTAGCNHETSISYNYGNSEYPTSSKSPEKRYKYFRANGFRHQAAANKGREVIPASNKASSQ